MVTAVACSLPEPMKISAAKAPVRILLRHLARFVAEASQLSVSILSSFRDAFGLSLYLFFCPPTRRLPSCSSP